MDPDVNLEEQRKLAARLIAQIDSEPADDVIDLDDVDRLIELVQALDQWISRGGFLPQAWQKKEATK